MKLQINRYSIAIIPEGETDKAYIEEVLGLKIKNQVCSCKRIAVMGLDREVAYLEVKKGEPYFQACRKRSDERQEEQTDYFRLKVNKLTDELGKVKVIKDQLLQRRIELGKEVISLRFELAKAKERVVQLEKAIDEWTKLYHSLQEHRVHND